VATRKLRQTFPVHRALSVCAFSRILYCSTQFRASQKRAGGYAIQLPDNLHVMYRIICKTLGNVNTFLSCFMIPGYEVSQYLMRLASP
jgi:hypothetical protein